MYEDKRKQGPNDRLCIKLSFRYHAQETLTEYLRCVNSTVQTETEAFHEEPKSKVYLCLSLAPLVHLHFILRKHEHVEKAKGRVPRISKTCHTRGHGRRGYEAK